MEYGANFIKPSEMWKDIKPRIGKMLAAVNDIETRAEKAQEEAYQKGLSDAWEAARKIGYSLKSSIVAEIFGTPYSSQIFSGYSASEAIEKIRQYEQEKDKQARIEYNFDEIKDVLETTAKECNVSLDEIAEVLQKMKES